MCVKSSSKNVHQNSKTKQKNLGKIVALSLKKSTQQQTFSRENNKLEEA